MAKDMRTFIDQVAKERPGDILVEIGRAHV